MICSVYKHTTPPNVSVPVQQVHSRVLEQMSHVSTTAFVSTSTRGSSGVANGNRAPERTCSCLWLRATPVYNPCRRNHTHGVSYRLGIAAEHVLQYKLASLLLTGFVVVTEECYRSVTRMSQGYYKGYTMYL
jgi:hypothetical protein